MSNLFMVKAGIDSVYFDDFKENCFVAIDSHGLTSIEDIDDLTVIKNTIADKNRDAKSKTVSAWAGMIVRFFNMKKGDQVITYNTQDMCYLVGTVSSVAKLDLSNAYSIQRSVDWKGSVYRSLLSDIAKNALRNLSSVFEIANDEIKAEILGKLDQPEKEEPVSQADISATAIEIEQETDYAAILLEMVQESINALAWEQMQDLTAALLRSLGYKTRVSPKGPDGGKDIIASKDGLCLSSPKIVVEVKHRERQMDVEKMRAFKSKASLYDSGLYISTGGFTKDAVSEANNACPPVTFLDLPSLAEMVIQNYDNFDIEGRQLLPLKKLYMPTKIA